METLKLTLTDTANDISVLEQEFNKTSMGADELKLILSIHSIAKVSEIDFFEDKAEEVLYLVFCDFLEKSDNFEIIELFKKLDIGFIFENYIDGAKLAKCKGNVLEHISSKLLRKLLSSSVDDKGSLKDDTRITLLSLFLNTKSSASAGMIE